MRNPSSNSSGPIPHEGLCQEIISGFEIWIDEYKNDLEGTVKQSLKQFLHEHLHDTSYQKSSDTISIPKRTAKCDIVINDNIGIKILYDLNSGSKKWIHKQLRLLFREYDHLIIYAHEIVPEHLDIWYQIKRVLKRRSRRGKSVHTLQTVQRPAYRIPLTNKEVRKAVVHKSLIYLLFTFFVFAGGQLLALADGTNIMAQAYVGAIIVFNIIVVVLGIFLVRGL